MLWEDRRTREEKKDQAMNFVLLSYFISVIVLVGVIFSLSDDIGKLKKELKDCQKFIIEKYERTGK